MYNTRMLEALLLDLLEDSPVVILTGARQTGKSTMLRHLFPARRIFDLDDLAILRTFQQRPDLALDDIMADLGGGVVVIDEVQRVPDLLIAIKRLVDGGADVSFILTGSANLTLLRHVSESLAGRAQRLELMPLAFSEWRGRPPEKLSIVVEQGAAAMGSIESVPLQERGELDSLRMQVLRHGSMPALLERSPASRARWLRGYHQTYLERDIRDVGVAVQPLLFSRSMEVASHRSSGIVSWSDMARDLGCSYNTVRRYVEVMRLGYQVFLLPPWSGSLGKRLVKSPCLYFTDTGVRNQVAGTTEPAGAVYETWIVAEVRKLFTAVESPPRLTYFRTAAGLEVDLLLEDHRGIVAIEIKARSGLKRSDATSLKRLGRDLGSSFRLGMVVYQGHRIEEMAQGIYAVPDVVLLS